MTRKADSGYAMVAAVAAIAAFGYIALEVLSADRTTLVGLQARATQARLTAAADAGVAMAIHGLAIEDRVDRWAIDGRPRALTFDGASLVVTVEDERGKIPLNNIDEDQTERMFEAAGASPLQAQTLTDAFLDWRDDDDDPRPHGAEAEAYPAGAAKPRNGAFQTVGELALIRGMTPEIYNRIAPAATVFFGESGGFSAATSRPFALGVMSSAGENSADVIDRERELDGQTTAISIADDKNLTGRPLTIRAEAADGHGGRAVRSMVVELTGDPTRPYWVRMLN